MSRHPLGLPPGHRLGGRLLQVRDGAQPHLDPQDSGFQSLDVGLDDGRNLVPPELGEGVWLSWDTMLRAIGVTWQVSCTPTT